MKKIILLFATLFFYIFDINAKIIYFEPVQNAKYVSIDNNIIIGFDETIESSNLSSLISVTGSLSGIHPGEIILTADRKKLIFKPHTPFVFNERVEVKLNRIKTSKTFNNRLSFTFQTQTNKAELYNSKIWTDESDNSGFSGNYSILPPLTVTISNNPSPGHIYLNSYRTTTYAPHRIVANNDGTIHYSQELPRNSPDFRRQPNGLLTYYYFTVGNSVGKYFAEDSQYNVVDSFYCGNGYSTDTHEMILLNNGHALLMSYDPQIVDMSVIVPGGNPNATVVGLIVQEIDENKNVVFQWRSWDHYSIVDAIHVNLTSSFIDYVHGNALEFDNDGNILISARHLSEITKINRSTGEIIWRLGGVQNQFTFLNDSIQFSYQHHIRRISNGNITMLDNGNFHTPQFSRAVEYNLDEVNKTATLVWEYRNNPVIYGPNRGSVQRLLSGNTLICWGGTVPTMTEVTPAGDIALEMSMPAGVFSYRVFKHEINLTLNLKLAIEGSYNSHTGNMSINDTVTAYVRNIISPFSIIDSSRSVIDSSGLTGSFTFYNVATGTYYISTRHRNSLETWSKEEGESFVSGGVYLYDFTKSDLQAYGNNLTLKGSKYCIYSGDVNQDGFIDLSDLLAILNDAGNFITGYVNTDLDADNIIELKDVLIAYNNSVNSVSVMTP